MAPVAETPDSMLRADRAKGMTNRVEEMFVGRTVFVTGGTGFMGKVLVEKILRMCPRVGQVILLVRPKKGKQPQTRMSEIFNSSLFDRLKSEQPEIMKRVKAVMGDVQAEDLGLSADDRARVTADTSIVYHCAATIRFDAPLKQAVMLNTRGTRSVLQLAMEMPKLEAFIHVSTAYCHLEQKILFEKPYPPPADPHKIIKCMELLEDNIAESMTKTILGTLPNTYAFTKALSEGIVVEYMDKLPVVILRPSIVIPIWKEPIPGWTDNLNGPMGLLIGAGKGVIRTMYCDSRGHADFIPVDVAVNATLMITWDFVTKKPKDPEKRVYNLTSSSEHKVSWEAILDIGRAVSKKIPLNGIVWYPGGSMKRSKVLHLICVFLFHTIPAYFLDAIIFLSGNKPVLRRVQARITKGFEVFEYYANRQWEFNNDNLVGLRQLQNEREYEELLIDGKSLELYDYFEKCTLAARLYLLGETLDTLPAARRHLKVMYWVDRITKVVLMGLLVWFFFSVAPPPFSTIREAIGRLSLELFSVFSGTAIPLSDSSQGTASASL
ncbi:fatty acyl-CoA reductase 1 [Ischnura elegans]|uniref:fatty acyl-CoA reductase 1 n=1 Tax=Ischnura elegans TaxID=197161 RepID=UPI001ED89A0D|nr:fatty acyl-CoA reductase 1 [Ischnura elegans]